jgi:glycosyltransferase involved in cell wall biosynthesis
MRLPNKMKILVLSTCYPRRSQPNHGIFIHRQIRALADLGAECHVIQPVEWSPVPPLHRLHPGWELARREHKDMLSEVEGIPIHHPRVYHPKPSRFFPGDYWERVGKAVLRYVRARRQLRSADLLYAHFLCHEGYAGLIVKRHLGIPLVAIARGDDVHAWPAKWPDRKTKLAAVLSEADGLLACSHRLAKDAEQWAAAGLARPFEVVYNGIDTDRFSPAEDREQKAAARRRFGLPQENRLVLKIATPIALKGWVELLDAFAALGDTASGWEIVMAGAPRVDGLDLVAEARERGIAARWLGTVSPDVMPDLYRAVDVFVSASHNEGLSNSMMEAMASGLPVVVTDVGGHAEVITHKVHGCLVQPRDSRALAAALGSVLGDGEFAGHLGRAARRRALEMGDHDTNSAVLLRYFEDLLRDLKRPAEEKRVERVAELSAS